MTKDKVRKKDVKKKPERDEKPRPRRPYVKTREDIEADDIRRYWREYEGEGGAF